MMARLLKRSRKTSTVFRGSMICLATALTAIFSLTLCGQEITNEKIQSHLQAGEFATALQLAEEFPTTEKDQWLAKIASAQSQSGARSAAVSTASSIGDDQKRSSVIGDMILQQWGDSVADYSTNRVGNAGYSTTQGGNDCSNANGSGRSGGITEADFEPLIELIKSTIAPDDWDDSNGDGVIQSYPAGVFVDAAGVMQRIKVDATTKTIRLRDTAMQDSGNRIIHTQSKLRKVSLNRLEKETQRYAATGEPVPASLANMAGLYDIEYLVLVPETGDVVIAGPAGPWKTGDEGRTVNAKNGKPVLKLDDLVVCLRNAYQENGKFGCTINPRAANLAKTKDFVSTSTLKGNAWRKSLRDALGRQDIEVFGIGAGTHAGRVIVEADYRMKLVAMGLEPTIPEVPSYLRRVKADADGNVPPMDVVRWWFTLNYDDVSADADRSIFTFNGTGVKVLSENEFIDAQGERVHTGQSSKLTAGFAKDFTDHFEKLSNNYPVYGQLKNVFDMALVASLIKQEGLAKKANWNLTYFLAADSRVGYQPAEEASPVEVDSVMNHRVISHRKKSSTVKTTIVGVSGGVTFNAKSAISAEVLKTDTSGKLATQAKLAKPPTKHWWWD